MLGSGQKVSSFLETGIKAIFGDDVVGKRIAGEWILDSACKVPHLLLRRGYNARQRAHLADRLELIGDKEPGGILSIDQAGEVDRSPQGSPQLIPFELLFFVFEEITCIEVVVAMKPEDIPV